MHHPITPSKPPMKGTPVEGNEHWYAKYRKAEQRFAAEEAASGKTEGSSEIERLRSQLSRLKPRDPQYQEVAQQLTRAYAEAYPGFEEDPAT